MSDLVKNKTWEVVNLKDIPARQNILRSKFVFDIKRDGGGNFQRFEARLVAMGFTQIEGVDYYETSASVMRTKTSVF